MNLSAPIIAFINANQELIDNENWEDLLLAANLKLSNAYVVQLLQILEETFPPLDFGELQWKLLYEMLPYRIKACKQLMGAVFMWKLLDTTLFGLSFKDVKFGLLDDPDMEWLDVKIGSTIDYKLISWKGQKI